MFHKFDYLVIKVTGVCNECEQYVESRVTISKREMDQFTDSAESLRNFKLQMAYYDLNNHKCEPINKESP